MKQFIGDWCLGLLLVWPALAVLLFVRMLLRDMFWDLFGIFGLRRPVPAETLREQAEHRRIWAEIDARRQAEREEDERLARGITTH